MAAGDWRARLAAPWRAATVAPEALESGLTAAQRAAGRAGLLRVRPPAGGAGGLTRLLDRHGAWLALALCAGLVALVYGQALTFAFTFDDPLDLPRAEGRSVWSLLSTSEGYTYYRPVPFIIWKGLRAAQGEYHAPTLHALTLAAHTGCAWLLYLLLRRLTGGHWGLLAAVLFITYPFSYQAVFGAHTLFHPLMTACLLATLLLYHDARRAPGGAGARPRLAGSVAAAIVALWTHEGGVVVLPLVIGLELVLLARARSRRFPRWPALYALATALFLAVWATVPKFARPDALSTASLAPNARFFLQGAIYPVAAQLDALGARWGFDPLGALWPASAGTLAAVLALYARGRRPWVPALALGAAAVVLAPAWLVLTWAYVEDGPRLLYPAAPAIAALWGLLPALRWRSRAATGAWRALALGLALAVAAQSVAFLDLRRDMWAEGTVLVEGVADRAAAHEGRPLLFLNVPAWFAPKRPEYPAGHVGLTAIPGYIGLGRSVYLHRGVEPPLESRGFYPDVNGWKYDFNAHGGPAGLEEFAALLRGVEAAYTVEMLRAGARVRQVGAVQPGGAAAAPAGPRFAPEDGGVVLVDLRFDLRGGELTGELVWDVLAPPPGDAAPVLRVRDGAGRTIAAGGGGGREYPLAGIAAPRLWQAGDRVRDRPLLRLPAALPPGDYAIWLAWEDRATGQSLPGLDGAHDPLPPEGVVLGEFTLP